MRYKYRYSPFAGVVFFLLGLPATLNLEYALSAFIGGSILLSLIFFALNLMPSKKEQKKLWITLIVFLPLIFFFFRIALISGQAAPIGPYQLIVFISIPLIIALSVGVFLFRNPTHFVRKIIIIVAILGLLIFIVRFVLPRIG